MARPIRTTDTRAGIDASRTFFITTRTAGGRSLFQSQRKANLLIDVLRINVSAARFKIHDFVVMPNHIHLLITVPGGLTIERAVQFIKGGFSFRVKKELEFMSEVWQVGFSDVGVRDRKSFLDHRAYIDNNPVREGLALCPEDYPHGSFHLKQERGNAFRPRRIWADVNGRSG